MAGKNSKKAASHADYDYDLICIGSGPAAVTAAVQASKLGRKVAIVEKVPKEIGGAWLHSGTIPSKTMREVLAAIQNVRSHTGSNWSNRLVEALSTKHLLNRAREVSQYEQDLVIKHLEANKIDVIRGFAYIEDRHQVRVIPLHNDSFLLTTDRIMVATGSRPRRPSDVPFDGWRVVDSDDILRLETLPRRMVIYGAGVIGCEYACIFGSLGVETTLVDGRSLILQYIDREVAEELQRSMEKTLGIEFILGKKLKCVKVEGPHAVVELEDRKIETDVCFFAAGRVSTTKGLGLERVGIETNDRGAIVVDEFFRTQVPNIYAAGDAIGPPALACTSAEQGRIAANHAFGTDGRTFPKYFPTGIYTIPEMSSVGMTEAEVKEAGIEYVVGRAHYDEIARGNIRGDRFGLLKIIASCENQRILGVHIVGADAANLVHIGQICMMTDMPLQDLVNSMIFNYPTLAEAYRVATFNALNKIFPSGDFSAKKTSSSEKNAA